MINALFFILYTVFAGILILHREWFVAFPWLNYAFVSIFGMNMVAGLFLNLTRNIFLILTIMMGMLLNGQIVRGIKMSETDGWNTSVVLFCIALIGLFIYLIQMIPKKSSATNEPQTLKNNSESTQDDGFV
jgi:hypothetical protein